MKTQRMLFASGSANLGGIQSSTLTRIKALRARGIQGEKLFLKSGMGRNTYADVRTYVTNRPERMDAILRSRRYHAISMINRTDLLASLRRTRYRGRVMFEVRGQARHALKMCHELTARDVGGIIVISRYVETLVRKALRVGDIPIHVVYNAVDTTLFRPLREIDRRALPPGAAAPERPIVLWVGRLSDNKNYLEMLQIAASLTSSDSIRPVFWVVGDTKAKDNTKQFWQQVRAVGVQEHVRLFPCVPHPSMVHVYNLVARSRGCVLSTSKSEGFQNSLLEGMACGVPVVSTAVGGNVELVEDGVNGRLYDLGHPAYAAEIIKSILTDASQWNTYGQAGMARVEALYTPEHHATAFLHVLESIPVMSYPPAGKKKRRTKASAKNRA